MPTVVLLRGKSPPKNLLWLCSKYNRRHHCSGYCLADGSSLESCLGDRQPCFLEGLEMHYATFGRFGMHYATSPQVLNALRHVRLRLLVTNAKKTRRLWLMQGRRLLVANAKGERL